ncbi:MAG: sodium:proton antiporter [bacterium]|jgi:Na+/H+ antiporter NhaD/arsenite permease-like protein|nr:sodium:proton antiporter [bacterium]
MKKTVLFLWFCLILASATLAQDNPVQPEQTAPDAAVEAVPDPAPATDANHTSETALHSEAAGHGGGHANLGEELPLWTGIPFVGILLSIALFPLFAPHFWHHHFPKIAFGWALLLAIPFVFAYKGIAVYEIVHILLLDYVPFIILLWALYTVAGGILLRGTLVGTPVVNTGMLLIGTILASWMGTTGAAMLLIRPFLRANKYRKNTTFMVCFFIFLVANVGGSLTPLGDPPLFLGFLHGVPFFWTFNLLTEMLFVSGILLVIYFFMDLYFYKKENPTPPMEEKVPLKLEGWHNFFLLGGVVGAVLMSGLVHMGEINIFGIHRATQDVLRDVLLILIGIASLVTTSKKVRSDNEFTWFPIQEVAYLFVGIFITMVPCLLILKAGPNGAAKALFDIVEQPYHYFWITGLLSSFLDNAPTYLTFFGTAQGQFYPGMPEAQAVPLLLSENAIYLKAISTGAVFFGANTYIGNAPNFMVRSIAEESGTPMPSFFGYFFLYACTILLPIFVLTTWIFF